MTTRPARAPHRPVGWIWPMIALLAVLAALWLLRPAAPASQARLERSPITLEEYMQLIGRPFEAFDVPLPQGARAAFVGHTVVLQYP